MLEKDSDSFSEPFYPSQGPPGAADVGLRPMLRRRF
jgi:hypothetical protein